MIREATFSDIPELWLLLQEMHKRSIYATKAQVLEKEAKALFFNAVKKHGNPYQGGTHFMVSEHKENIDGFILGMLDTVYQVSDKFSATDIFFYVSPKANHRVAGKLLQSFLDWAETHPKVIEIYMGATNAIAEYQRTEKLYQRKGLTQCGVIYEKRVK